MADATQHTGSQAHGICIWQSKYHEQEVMPHECLQAKRLIEFAKGFGKNTFERSLIALGWAATTNIPKDYP